MKNLVFKYFDTFCYGELCENIEDKNWLKPDNLSDAFGYSTEFNQIFYNELLQHTIYSMFSVGRTEFKELLGEWFEHRYQLPVNMIL
jgi:hypothetical protein